MSTFGNALNIKQLWDIPNSVKGLFLLYSFVKFCVILPVLANEGHNMVTIIAIPFSLKKYFPNKKNPSIGRGFF